MKKMLFSLVFLVSSLSYGQIPFGIITINPEDGKVYKVWATEGFTENGDDLEWSGTVTITELEDIFIYDNAEDTLANRAYPCTATSVFIRDANGGFMADISNQQCGPAGIINGALRCFQTNSNLCKGKFKGQVGTEQWYENFSAIVCNRPLSEVDNGFFNIHIIDWDLAHELND